MKLSDFIINWFVERNVTTCFGISGGAILHLMDSAHYHPKMKLIHAQHEQHAGAMADGYSRISKNIGLCLTTSGPGATNLLTSVCNAWFDSVPVFFITGQVATHRLNKDPTKKQNGFQETDIVSIFKPVTKVARQLKSAQGIVMVLPELFKIAVSDTPGPVILDIPDNLQRENVDV